jgi:hypothetical protein
MSSNNTQRIISQGSKKNYLTIFLDYLSPNAATQGGVIRSQYVPQQRTSTYVGTKTGSGRIISTGVRASTNVNRPTGSTYVTGQPRVISTGTGNVKYSPSRNCKIKILTVLDKSSYVPSTNYAPISGVGTSNGDLIRRINEESRKRSQAENDKNRFQNDLESEKRKNVEKFNEIQKLKNENARMQAELKRVA